MNSFVNWLFLLSLCGYVLAAPAASKCGNNAIRNGGGSGSAASGENDGKYNIQCSVNNFNAF